MRSLRRRQIILTAVGIVVLALSACGDSDVLGRGPSSERVTLRPAGSVEGTTQGFLEYLPPGYGDGRARPLLLFLHGFAENGDGSKAALDRLSKLAIPNLVENDEWPASRPFIVLAPQYDSLAAQECLLAEEIDSFLRFAINRYDVDPDRVYVTGISCGAIGAWHYLGAHRDELVAGAVLIAGHDAGAVRKAGCEVGRVPIWALHGESDLVVPKRFIVGPVREIEECADPQPRDVRLTIYPGTGHDAWSKTYDLSAGNDIYGWLLRQTNR